jgi:hypothetical protein
LDIDSYKVEVISIILTVAKLADFGVIRVQFNNVLAITWQIPEA